MPNENPGRDKELIAALRAGDADAFDVLLAHHGDDLYRFIRRLAPEAAIEDVLQETLVAAFRGAASFRGDSAVRTWLFGIAVRQCHRQRRRRIDEPAVHEPLEALAQQAGFEDEESPEAILGRMRLSGCLRSALNALNEADREILLLRDIEGLSGPEVSEVLGIPLDAMKSRLHRARLRLVASVRQRRCTDER